MKNLKHYCLMAITGLFLFLGGCQKEEDIQTEKADLNIKRRLLLISDSNLEEESDARNFTQEYPTIYRDVVKSFKNINKRNALFQLSDIRFTDYVDIGDSIHKVFTFFINSSFNDRFFNYVLEKEGDIYREYVLEYKPNIYSSFGCEMSGFSGTIKKITFENAFSNICGSFTSTRDDDRIIIYCWKLLFENGKDKGYFTTPKDGSGSVPLFGGSGGSGENYEMVCIPCPCRGHTCTENCSCRSGKPYYIIRKKENFRSNGLSGSRDDQYECGRILILNGIVTPDREGSGNGNSNESEAESQISALLGVSTECINKLDKNARFELAKMIAENKYIDPCNPSKSSNEILGDAVSSACERATGKVTSDAIMETMDGYPHIKISKNLATDCPKLNCILNKLINSDSPSSDFLCDLMSKFAGSPNFAIAAQFPSSSDNPKFTGKTEVINNNILISFNKGNCKNIDGLDLFETFQHELIHADFYRQLINDYGWTGDSLTLDATFKLLVNKKYGPNATTDQHVLMLNEILPNMINSLMQANGNNTICDGKETIGPCLYFKSLILNGFSEELLENELGISFELHKQNYIYFNLWKLSQSLFLSLNDCQ